MAGRSTSCDVAWSLARSWIAQCSLSHKSCGPQNPNFVPTRLLEIDADAEKPIKLVVAAEEEKRCCPITRYASLSHCWGGADVPTLTSQTIAGLRQGISLDKLPRTFAEAVAAVRRLGINHLWIDSLCIVQDSADDWASEAGIMGDVYANSTLNIMATASRDSHGGLYRDRDPEVVLNLVRVETGWTHHTQMTTEMGRTKDYYFLADRDLWQDSVAEAPLNTRGWVLQERVLSPRALHFGSHQFLWECRELSACETYPAGLPEVLLGDVDRIKPVDPKALPALSIPRPVAALPGAPDAPDMTVDDQTIVKRGVKNVEEQLRQARLEAWLFELASLWSNWVQAYSAAKLTRRSDKMIAISGLAKMMRTLRGSIGDRYLAGLWRVQLVDQLLWYAVSPAPRTRILGAQTVISSRTATGIPSWSWMSIDVEVVPGFPTTRQDGVQRHIQVLEVSTTPASAGNETGALLGGELRVRGSLLQATLSPAGILTVNGGDRLDVEFHADEEEGTTRRTEVVLLPVMTDDDGEVSLLCLRREGAKPQGWYLRVGHLTAHADVVRHAAPRPGLGERDQLYLHGQIQVLVVI